MPGVGRSSHGFPGAWAGDLNREFGMFDFSALLGAILSGLQSFLAQGILEFLTGLLSGAFPAV
jgi:hypothetical protein